MLSADGKRVAFTTWVDGKNLVVVEGRAGEPFDAIVGAPVLSDDGAVAAYAARRRSEQFCVVGDRVGPPYSRVGRPALSHDGRSVAYAAQIADAAFVVLNGSPGPAFYWTADPVLSGDGRRVAYVAQEARNGSYESFVVVDHQRGPAYDRVTRPEFSGDGRTVVYGARLGGRWFLVRGDLATPVDGEIDSVFVNQDGSRAGCVIEHQRSYTIGDGRMFDWIGWPMLAGDVPVYFGSRGAVKFLVIGSREIELGEWVVWGPALSADGSTLSFGARIGRELWRKVVRVR